MKCRVFGIIVLCASALYSSGAQAQSTTSQGASPVWAGQSNQAIPEYIQEFFLSEAVRNQDKGELQFTVGSDNRESLGSNLALDVEYGLTDRIQVSSETPYGLSATVHSESPAGWSTTDVGVNYQFIRTNSPFALTAGMSFGIPVKPGAGLSFEPKILAAKTFRLVQVHASLIAEVEKGDSSFQYNLASVWLVSHQWFPTLEFNGRRLDSRSGFYATPGLYRHLPHRLEVGLGTPIGIGGIAGRPGIVGDLGIRRQRGEVGLGRFYASIAP